MELSDATFVAGTHIRVEETVRCADFRDLRAVVPAIVEVPPSAVRGPHFSRRARTLTRVSSGILFSFVFPGGNSPGQEAAGLELLTHFLSSLFVHRSCGFGVRPVELANSCTAHQLQNRDAHTFNGTF